MFVLSAAVKAYRESTWGFNFAQHRMLVLGSVRVNELTALHTQISELWMAGDFDVPAGQERLQEIFESDLLPASRYEGAAALPDSFAQLMPSLDKVLHRLGRHPICCVTDRGPRIPEAITLSSPIRARNLNSAGFTVMYLSAPTHPATLTAVTAGFVFQAGHEDLMRIYVPDVDACNATVFLSKLDAYQQADEELRGKLVPRF
ncbi:hypothetical protein [Polymorphospora rubra]|uniref:hypothetical protein n=1 Tax=Polymorphospora rubra TaxID=338584 RepID=UPI0031D956AD